MAMFALKILRTLLVFAVFGSSAIAFADPYASQRQQMIEEIEQDVIKTSKYIDQKGFDKRVMQAMNTTPRHEFVPENQLDSAYDNRPLPIGYVRPFPSPTSSL